MDSRSFSSSIVGPNFFRFLFCPRNSRVNWIGGRPATRVQWANCEWVLPRLRFCFGPRRIFFFRSQGEVPRRSRARLLTAHACTNRIQETARLPGRVWKKTFFMTGASIEPFCFTKSWAECLADLLAQVVHPDAG